MRVHYPKMKLLLQGFAVGPGLFVAPLRAADSRSNLLFLLAAYLGWGAVGFPGANIRPPVLGRLAREGVARTQHEVDPPCAPPRSAPLLFGVKGSF